jgi:hypothetical protein
LDAGIFFVCETKSSEGPSCPLHMPICGNACTIRREFKTREAIIFKLYQMKSNSVMSLSQSVDNFESFLIVNLNHPIFGQTDLDCLDVR